MGGSETPQMDSPAASSSPSTAAGTGGEDPPRAKFLCSFGGSILPRPLDGRLRYVGGETRIVSLPRNASYDDLLARMRELFDGVAVIKYQQPDEDLDALVSVVNDDDVVNMMEEYDKLVGIAATGGDGGSGGFTRLRIFLFSHHNPDPDAAAAAAAAHFDIDERETERRYVDALNSLVDSEIQDHFFGPGLHQLNIPHSHSRYGEDSPWSPAYFSPSQGRGRTEFPNSPSFDQQSPPFMEKMMWLPPGAMVQEKAGFPGNLGYAHNVLDGGSGAYEHCRMSYQRSQAHVPDTRHVEPRWNGGNEYMGNFSESSAECYRKREAQFYNEAHGHDHVWHLHPPPPHGGHRVEDPRMHLSGAGGGKMGDHCVVDGNMMNLPFGHGNFFDGHDDGHYLRPLGNELGGELFRAQQGVGHGNHPSQYGMESPHQVPPNLPPIQNLRRWPQGPVLSGTPYDPSGLMAPNGFVRNVQDGSLRVPWIGMDDQIQNPWCAQNGGLSQKCGGIEDHSARLNPNFVNRDERILVAPDVNLGLRVEEVKEENLDTKGVKPSESTIAGDSNVIVGREGQNVPLECFTYLPELIASVKKVALESAGEVKARAEENPEDKKKQSVYELETENTQAELEVESDGDGEQNKISKIEPTTAEADALAQGLQTIKNDDLEEIRELGSGTYGSVFHGKWKGSDVAIKRIKASCFNGKPSERERLIADFWKEALTLSSLHHPNVVAFYGVVRDGPDGSLATVTEFMVNGSLKQFLQKKDRTIDRRKRLIIAMDVAFGMEYLHGKNIVHFDLKCENLLVNMRDPQRPICKIGDLGLSKVKQRTLVSGGVRGTLPWMAPELLSGKNNMVTEKVDVYSFGIVMWELLTGEEPYGDMHCGSIIGGIMSNSLRPQIPTWCDPEWKSLMERCWSSDPGERPSFSEISQKLRKMAAAINVK